MDLDQAEIAPGGVRVGSLLDVIAKGERPHG